MDPVSWTESRWIRRESRCSCPTILSSPPHNLRLRKRSDSARRKLNSSIMADVGEGDYGDYTDDLPPAEYVKNQRAFLN